jgi:hypothetical protein
MKNFNINQLTKNVVSLLLFVVFASISVTAFAGSHPHGSTTITSFAPTQGVQNDHIIITGANFANVTSVTFGGKPAQSFQIISDTQIDAVLDSGRTGAVVITGPGIYDSLAGFTYLYKPQVLKITPTIAAAGDLVTIKAIFLVNVIGVTFGGVPAKSFSVVSPNQINAYVDNGATGSVAIILATGADSISGFVYNSMNPTIDHFTPTSAQKGNTVSVFGNDFVNVQAVYFGGIRASSFKVTSTTQIDAVVDSGASGSVTVQTAAKTATLAGFTYIGPQTTITSFSPATASTGTTVQISGTNFVNVFEVDFGGTKAKSFQVVSPTKINAVVDAGSSGDVMVRSDYNTATLPGFTFQPPPPPPPTITTINPFVAKIGDPIVITGTNLSTATAVTFGGKPVASFQVNGDTKITAILGDGDDGNVVVTTPAGQATFSGFTFNSPPPKIASVSALAGGKGTVITITGDYFTRVNQVKFGGTAAAGFQVISRTQIQAQVDYGSSGYIAVFSPLGIDSIAGFTYTPPPPVIAWLDPSSVTEDMELIISGDNVGYATAVTIGGVPVKSIKVYSPGLIHVFVGPGIPGAAQVVVTTPNGTVSSGTNFYAPQPQVSSFSPLTGSVGTVVTVKGKYFKYANYVDFLSDVTSNLKSAYSFRIISDSLLTAVVDTACTGMLGVGNNRRSYGWSSALFTYRDPLQPLVAASGTNPVSGAINTEITVDSSVQEYNGNPYVQRHYDIEPVNNPSTSTALVTLYFFQYEFDNYNQVPNHGFDLPTGPADIANKANLRVYQYHGFSATSTPGTYDSTGIEINPDDNNIVWNAVTQMWEVTFEINGFSGFFVASMGSAILPLKLLSFSAQQKEHNVMLNWKTADEKNVAHFEILKSSDGTIFTWIATVKSLLQAGENTYSYNDPAGNATTNYYRIKVVDNDGKFTLSNVVKTFGVTDNVLAVYPNPAREKITVTYPQAKENNQVKLIDLSGRIVKIVKMEKGSIQTIINLQGVAAGPYKIVWSDGKQTIVKSLIVE